MQFVHVWAILKEGKITPQQIGREAVDDSHLLCQYTSWPSNSHCPTPPLAKEQPMRFYSLFDLKFEYIEPVVWLKVLCLLEPTKRSLLFLTTFTFLWKESGTRCPPDEQKVFRKSCALVSSHDPGTSSASGEWSNHSAAAPLRQNTPIVNSSNLGYCTLCCSTNLMSWTASSELVVALRTLAMNSRLSEDWLQVFCSSSQLW